MSQLDAKDLAEHVERVERASAKDVDELLTRLLVLLYPTKPTQDC